MKRDITVIISLVFLAIAWSVSALFEVPPDGKTTFRALYYISAAFAFLGMFRAILLWAQTMKRVCTQGRRNFSAFWFLLHFIVPPFTPYVYYFLSGAPTRITPLSGEPPLPDEPVPEPDPSAEPIPDDTPEPH